MTRETPDPERTRLVELEHLEGFRFRVEFGGEIPPVIADEPPPLGSGSGPDAARMLAAAIGNCLSASLLLCLQKSRVEVQDLRTRATLAIARNDEGRLRVSGVRVRITLVTGEEPAKLQRCIALFENYCTVTASVRAAFPVEVDVVDSEGRALHHSAGEAALEPR